MRNEGQLRYTATGKKAGRKNTVEAETTRRKQQHNGKQKGRLKIRERERERAGKKKRKKRDNHPEIESKMMTMEASREKRDGPP